MNFEPFFQVATGHAPYDYQCRLAGRDSGAMCASQLITVPTGLGKTAAVVLAWLWNRLAPSLDSQPATLNSPEWPRRLVYCLPMRTLVEQTAGEVEKWIAAILADEKGELVPGAETKARLEWLAAHSPVILMGGEDAGEWDIHPEREAILIGTQDMLLSRALNRGYGMSRYRWPMHFGLLNNDCLWVMDETQLMGVGIETSAQLEGFRSSGEMPTVGACRTWWMSATLDKSRLDTVDHKNHAAVLSELRLSKEEEADGRPHKLITAPKKLSPAPLALNATTKNDYPKQLATLIKERHQSDTLTLVVVNRVSRAREIFEALTKPEKKGKQPLYAPERVALIHSRFRPEDRAKHEALLFGKGDRIVIATQAVEAGVDVSARLLLTELAPWSSLVQRLGRCNRRAEFADAEVLWVDVQPKDEKDDLLLPYAKGELDKSRSALAPLTNASPLALRDAKVEPEEKVIRPVIRRRDLVDLFDTTPDLCGQDIDISRYIRDSDDNDVQFFWRDIKGDAPPENEPAPVRAELCRVSVRDAARFLGKKPRAWRWNPLDEEWEPAASARPGSIYLVDVSSGGYDNATGWTGDAKDKPTPCPPSDAALERYAANRLSLDRDWQTIGAHTALVVAETSLITTALGLRADDVSTLRSAALWHDVGKAHEHFQEMLRDGPHQPGDATALYAKSKNPPKPGQARRDYRSIRHELASALAWLLAGPHDAPERDLTAYLIAAHHGKVRLSLRSLPGEPTPDTTMSDGTERLFARGIWHGDKLRAVALGEITTPAVTLDLSFMQMGEGPRGESQEVSPSWLARAIAVRDRLGPFRLAFLETLLRAADARASRTNSVDPKPGDDPGVSSGMELREVPPADGAAEVLTPAEQSLVADLVEDGLSIQEKFRPEPLYQQAGQGHYAGNTVEDIQRAKQTKPRGGPA